MLCYAIPCPAVLDCAWSIMLCTLACLASVVRFTWQLGMLFCFAGHGFFALLDAVRGLQRACPRMHLICDTVLTLCAKQPTCQRPICLHHSDICIACMELVLCGAGAFQVCISRISGICIGVGVSLLLSIIIYPSSASVKAMSCLRQVTTQAPFIMFAFLLPLYMQPPCATVSC